MRTTLGTEWAGLHVIIYGVLTIVIADTGAGRACRADKKAQWSGQKEGSGVQVREGGIRIDGLHYKNAWCTLPGFEEGGSVDGINRKQY